MIAAVALSFAVVAAPSPESSPESSPELEKYLPCTAGLSIEYAIESKNTGKKYTSVETVLGPGKEARSCLIERRTGAEREVLMREHLDDRISNAGYADQPVALRAPLLKAPVLKDKGWYFTSTRFTIADIGVRHEVPAGTFADCVRVHEAAKDGSHEADSVYAPTVGLIAYESRDLRMRAIRVDKTPALAPAAKERRRPALKKASSK